MATEALAATVVRAVMLTGMKMVLSPTQEVMAVQAVLAVLVITAALAEQAVKAAILSLTKVNFGNGNKVNAALAAMPVKAAMRLHHAFLKMDQ